MQRSVVNFKSNTTRMQTQEKEFVYGVDWLSEGFRQGATQLDN